LSAAADEIVTGTFSMIGAAGAVVSTSVASSVTSAGRNTPMTGTANVIDLREGGAPMITAVQSIRMTIQNNLRALRKVGSKPAFGIGAGGVDVTGTLKAYFEEISLYQKFINHTNTSLSFKFKDVSGNFVVVTIPSVYYTSGDPQITGQDADVFVNLQWVARRDPIAGYTVQLDFLPA
ncbi:MAG TPA: phage tail tube protein, partial [Kiloniellales bacterium]